MSGCCKILSEKIAHLYTLLSGASCVLRSFIFRNYKKLLDRECCVTCFCQGGYTPLAPLKRLSTVDYPAHLNIIQKIILRMVATCGGFTVLRTLPNRCCFLIDDNKQLQSKLPQAMPQRSLCMREVRERIAKQSAQSRIV